MSFYPLFIPMLAMMLLTMIVWFYMYTLRLNYVMKARIHADKLHAPEQVSLLLPDHVNAPSNNLKNLFELPVLFYGVILVASQIPDHSIISNLAAWSFLFFRVIHSIIHCSNGKVLARFIVYVLSSLSLFVLIANVLLSLFNQQ
ncbi:MAPEG family protein [Thalassotalea atypica]|uniref:MAPEG family protein n=1 Tax=Thalassotalea atypica TaxID=2054316 RepID=UPI00257477A8|nr:MAPEG family protein [Thalassotalea atypica]